MPTIHNLKTPKTITAHSSMYPQVNINYTQHSEDKVFILCFHIQSENHDC